MSVDSSYAFELLTITNLLLQIQGHLTFHSIVKHTLWGTLQVIFLPTLRLETFRKISASQTHAEKSSRLQLMNFLRKILLLASKRTNNVNKLGLEIIPWLTTDGRAVGFVLAKKLCCHQK